MYNVSNAYKSQMSGAVFKFDLEGRLTNTGAFYADNILAGSLSITNQCSSGDKIIMGSVYAGELRATFVDTNDIVVGDTITVSESMWVDSLDRYETVPLGAFKVAESVRTRSGIEVVAYDYMSKFNKKAELAQVYGTPFEWLRYCCSMCGVTMAQTQAEIEALPNGLASFECYMREDFECTYRDVVSWLAQIIGGFATMDRQGQVKLVSYAMAQTPVYDVRAYSRYNDYSFSLHTTEWDAIKYLYVAGGTEEEETVGTPTSEDTTFDFGYNPFLQNRADASTMLTNLLSVVESMTYVPFKIKVASGAAFDLGDLLTQFGGHAPNPTTSRYIVTCIDWKYNGGTTLSGAGKDVSIGSGGSGSSSQSSGGGGGGQTYNDFVGATSSADGTHGLVPAPLIADRTKFLCGDGTWKAVGGGGGGGNAILYGNTNPINSGNDNDGDVYYLLDSNGKKRGLFLYEVDHWELIEGHAASVAQFVVVGANLNNTDAESTVDLAVSHTDVAPNATVNNFVFDLKSLFYSGYNQYTSSTTFVSFENYTLRYHWTDQSGSTKQWFDICYIEDVDDIQVLSDWTTYTTAGTYNFSIPPEAQTLTVDDFKIDFRRVQSGRLSMEKTDIVKSISNNILQITLPDICREIELRILYPL